MDELQDATKTSKNGNESRYDKITSDIIKNM